MKYVYSRDAPIQKGTGFEQSSSDEKHCFLCYFDYPDLELLLLGSLISSKTSFVNEPSRIEEEETGILRSFVWNDVA